MRCEDLTRELASPTGHLSQAEMAGHLADCPSCAEWSRRAAHLDQIWEATRPAEPSEANLDILWASASAALDARTVPATLRLEGLTHGRRSWLKPAFRVAQAAAILAAAVFLFRQGGHEQVQVAFVEPAKPQVKPIKVEPPKDLTTLNVNVEIGETALVKIGENSSQIELQKESTQGSYLPDLTQFDVSRGVEAMEPTGLGSVAFR